MTSEAITDEGNGSRSELQVLDVPVIDLSVQLGGEEEMCRRVREACEEWGCFLAVNHGIDRHLLQSMDSVIQDLFALPTHAKENLISPTFFKGYLGRSKTEPFYETMAIPGIPPSDSIEEYAHKLWPQGYPKFCEIMKAYSQQAVEVANKVTKMLLRSLGEEMRKYYESHFGRCEGHLRLNHYSRLVPAYDDESVGLPEHTDTSCFTILYQHHVGGLQIRTKDGEWYEVKLLGDHESIVVIVGEILEAWTNTKCRCVQHRVVYRGVKPRVSAALFWNFEEEMEIWAPAELIDDQHPRLYRPFMISEYKKFKQRVRFDRTNPRLLSYRNALHEYALIA
eukprot:Gb_29875 [translate_table: standard]